MDIFHLLHVGIVLSFSKKWKMFLVMLRTEERRQQMDKIDKLIDTKELKEVENQRNCGKLLVELKCFSYDKKIYFR